MNTMQEKFYHFIKERVKKEYINEADVLLKEGFSKQMDGTFDKTYLDEYAKTMMTYIKTENKEEVQRIISQFSKNL